MPTNILMPALSPTMTEGTLAKWHKNEGDVIKAGQVIAEIETDKATMEVEAVDEGKLGKILVPAGTAGVKVNAPIAVLLADNENVADIKPMTAAPAPVAAPALAAAPAAAPAPVAVPVAQAAAPAPAAGNRVFATPLARRLAAEKGVNLTSVQGTGPSGRITKADIESAPVSNLPARVPGTMPMAAPASAITATMDKLGQRYRAIPHNNIKKVTAKRLQESKQTIPHFYLTVDCQIDELLKMRKRINATGLKVSVNDFVVRAVALALREVPGANAAWTDDALLMFEDVDISVAVATPNGLITPIVKSADKKGLSIISEEVRELAGRAKEGKLKPEEFMGGGFTISNLGMFGIKEFAAIINPPQSCILAVGAGEQKPVVNGAAIEIATVMSVTLSCDHRSVDGAVGAEFLGAFKRRIEDPALMLL
jgi:pyruvate dehydrogenase E2 component (dihydrolipoamide acetyltransferase)